MVSWSSADKTVVGGPAQITYQMRRPQVAQVALFYSESYQLISVRTQALLTQSFCRVPLARRTNCKKAFNASL